MKYKFYFTPSKLNQKLRKINSSNNNCHKELLYRNSNININNIKSIPSLTNKFCYLKNKTKLLKDSLNKIPLIPINQENFNDNFSSHNFKTTKNMSIITSYNSPTQNTSQKPKYQINVNKSKYLPYRHKRNNTEIYFNKNNLNKINHKLTYYSRNNNLNTILFFIEDCKRKYEEKIIKLNEKISNKNKIIDNMQILVDEALTRLNKSNKKNEILQNKLNILNAKIAFEKINSKN